MPNPQFPALHEPHPDEQAFNLGKHWTFGGGNIFDHSHVWAFEGQPDQGYSQECLAFFLSSCVHASPYSLPSPNPDAIYAEMCAIDGRQHDPDTGSTVPAMVRVAQRRGYFKSALYTKVAAQAWQFISDLNAGPAGLALPWFQDMMFTDDSGYLVLPKKMDVSQALGGHIVMLNGTEYGDNPDFLAVNWLPMYGLNGRFRIRFNDLCRILDLVNSVVVLPTKFHFDPK